MRNLHHLSPAEMEQWEAERRERTSWPFSHRVSVQHRAGSLVLDVEFTLSAPWTALFAPSGAGKTTILRIVAGLTHPDHGLIHRVRHRPDRPGEEALGDPEEVILHTEWKLSDPAFVRGIRLVAQRPALFPHLSVEANVGYGMAFPRAEPAARRARLNEVLALCRADHLRSRMPAQLSGGEAQRVALARALAPLDSHLLLLDEPFSGLDSALRDELVADLRVWTAAQPSQMQVLLVTHDLAEVFAAGAEVLKLEGGRITSCGPAAEVLAGERQSLLTRLGSPSTPASPAPAPG